MRLQLIYNIFHNTQLMIMPAVSSACTRRNARFLAQEQTCVCGPAQSFAEEFFYAWQYERPASPWLFALSALLVVVVMALCLFPLAPHWCQS